MRVIGLMVIVIALAACSSSTAPSPNAIQANPCAIPGATYRVSAVAQSGNCGYIPDSIVNIGNNGTVVSNSPIQCQRIEQDGCRARDTNCVQILDNGCKLTATTDMTFSDDGVSASGLESLLLTCPDNSGCYGMYKVYLVQQ